MKKALTNLLLFAFFSLPVLYAVQYIADTGLKQSKAQYFNTWNDIYNSKINTDVVICGASRAKLVISPKILDSVLHISSYNIGINGGYFPVQDALFKIYLQHNKKPKYIIQNVDFMTFTDGNNLVDAEQYIPYLSNPIISDLTDHYIQRYTWPEKHFPLFKYNNHFNFIKEGFSLYFHIGNHASNKLYKGFAPITTPFDDYFTLRMQKEGDFIRNNIQKNIDSEFVAYLDFCKANDIKLIFVYGPVLREARAFMRADTSAITRKLMQYAQQYNIPFLNYVDEPSWNSKQFFADHIHANYLGSQAFNERLANDLKGIIPAAQ